PASLRLCAMRPIRVQTTLAGRRQPGPPPPDPASARSTASGAGSRTRTPAPPPPGPGDVRGGPPPPPPPRRGASLSPSAAWARGRFLAAGSVWALEGWDTFQALAIAVPLPADDERAARLEVRYADGMAEGLGRLALALRTVADAQGCKAVELWLPNLLILHDA